MDTKYNFFVFETSVPLNITKGVVYITSYGEDYVSIFRSLKQYEDNVEKIESLEDTVNVFVDRGVYSSAVDCRVNNPSLPRDCIFIRTDDNISKILKRLKNGDTYNYYDIFSAKSISDTNAEDVADISKYIKIFYYIMLQYMNAGYHRGKNTIKIPDWCVCFSEPIMKYFLEYFEIRTESPDISVVDEFLTNPQFREMITLQMMKFMANYSVNNNIVDPQDVDSWYNVKFWISIKSNI